MIPRIHPEGYPYIAGFAVATVILFVIAQFLGWIGLILTAWCVYFFRDPVRVVPDRAGLVISPADGVVCQVGRAAPPEGLEMGSDPMTKVSIFMNVFDVHVNRAPATASVEKMKYTPGKFVNASFDKASEENERLAFRLKMVDGAEIAMVQIAGLVARRIVAFVGEGAHLHVGDRYGLIRFGSRVDMYLPADTAPQVALGQRVLAGETVLADLTSTEPIRAVREV